MKSLTLTAVLVLTMSLRAGATELSDLAASMQPGQWAELSTNNISAALSAGGASGFVFGYTEELRWDPKSRRLLYVGGDHNDTMRFVTYSESSNSWVVPAQPSWLPGGTNHGYDHMAIDAVRGFFYARESYYGAGFYRFNTATNAWSAVPQNGLLEYQQCCGGVEVFPEMDGLVWVQGGETSTGGGLFIYRESTNQWERLARDLPMGIYHNFLEYSPVHKVVVFGGGNGDERAFYKMNASGQVTALPDAPLSLGIQNTVFTVDPVSGDFLVFAAGNVFYTYNPTTSTWKHVSSSSPVFNVSMVHGIVAAPISSYGVVLFVKADSSSFHVYLYKHADGGVIEPPPAGDTTAPTVPSGLAAAAASSSQVNVSWRAASDNVGVAGYYLYRNSTRAYTVSSLSCQDTGLAASTTYNYRVSAFDAAGNESGLCAAVSATTSAAPPPPPGGGGDLEADADFELRRTSPGVVRWFSFDSQAETDPHIMPPWGMTTKRAQVVTDTVKSGAGSLRFDIPSNSGSDSSGSFWLNFADNFSVQFGEGQEFYVQWRERFSPEFLNTYYEGGGGWKQCIIGEGDRSGFTAYSCTQLEIVTQNTFQRGIPQMYHSCGGKDGKYEPFEPPVGSYDFLLQNAVDCRYSLVTSSSDPSQYCPPCVGYKANQWMTFQVRVKIGTWYHNDGNYHKNSTVQLWVAEEGQPSTLVIDMTGYDIANDDPASKYGKVWLLPYHTGKSASQAHPTAYVWYDELIISRNRVPDPSQPQLPPDTVAPAAPKSLRVE